MKMKTSEVAHSLGIHPSFLFQYLVGLAPELTFEDVWPEIDQNWVDTISALAHRGIMHKPEQASVTTKSASNAPTQAFSDDAFHVLDKLSRQGKWGNASVTLEALLNLTHISKRDLEDIVTELRRKGFLCYDRAGRGTISLNSAKRHEIETITQQTHPHRHVR